MWRPSNWSNPYPADTQPMQNIAYENMADNIIKALCSVGISLNIPKGYSCSDTALQMLFKRLTELDGPYGHLVWIPDDTPRLLDDHNVYIGGDGGVL